MAGKGKETPHSQNSNTDFLALLFFSFGLVASVLFLFFRSILQLSLLTGFTLLQIKCPPTL